MKNLLAYTPELFDNLELENFEYEPVSSEDEMEDEGPRRGKRVPQSARRIAGRGRMPLLSKRVRQIKPSFRPRIPVIPFAPPRIVSAASVNVFPPAGDRRPSGQSNSSGNAGGEGSFANAPAQDPSEHVRWVQETLNRALGLRLIVDGIMNRETRSAVRMFQERKGLPVTGLVGPDTEEALRAEGGQAAAELLEGESEQEQPYCFYNPAGDCVTLWGNNPSDAVSPWRLRNWWNSKWSLGNMKYCGAGNCNCKTIDEPTAKCPAITGEFDLTEVNWEDETAQNSLQKVRWIQESLNKSLGLRLKVDGIMGPQTKSAIRSFQQKNGLAVDGAAGQGTVNALQAALSANGALPPASSTVIATTNLPILGSSDFRARAIKLLQPLPPYPQEISSNGPQRHIFTQMTGLTQEMLRDAWTKGKNLTSCNAFTGWFSRAMGSKTYLGRFDLDKFASRSWVPATSGRTPKYGDILRFKTFHVGIELDLVDGILHTAEGG